MVSVILKITEFGLRYYVLDYLPPKVGKTQDPELSVLLARDLLIPIVHNTTYEALREVSPMLASRSGLSTIEGSMANSQASSPSWSLPSYIAEIATCRANGADAAAFTPNLSL